MRSRRATISTCIVLIGLVVLATSGAVAAGPDDPDRSSLRPGGSVVAGATNATGTAHLDDAVVSVQQGEVARLRIRLTDTDEATVVLGGNDAASNVTVTVTDESGDGTVPLDFHTAAVGMDRSRFVPADEGDEYATANAGLTLDEPVPVGDYPISVYVGHGVGGEPSDVGTLAVTEATPPPNASIGGERPVRLHPRSGQVVSGSADLDAGREVSVRLRSSGEQPFLKSRAVSIGEDGGFSATFNLSAVDAPANATATVSVDGRRIAGPVAVTVVEESSTSGQPGFGPVVAVLAIVTVAVVGLRYRG